MTLKPKTSFAQIPQELEVQLLESRKKLGSMKKKSDFILQKMSPAADMKKKNNWK